jgi:nitrile hydratase accessory protein
LSKIGDLVPAEMPANIEEGRVFDAPWQARAFAVAVTMCQASHYTWDEFREHLMTEIAEHADDDEYYHHWLSALEKLLAEKGFVAEKELDAKTQEFAKPK